MTTTNAPTRPRSPLLGAAIVVIFAVVAALLFSGIYLGLPGNDHFYGLIDIGILSLVFALGAYLAQSVAPDPSLPRALSWGFAGLGFALLLGTILVNPGSVLGFFGVLIALIIVLLFLAIALLGAYWRSRAVRMTEARGEARSAWRAAGTPPSALDYATAQHERDIAPPSAPPKVSP